jgi:hypothetical protein
MKQTDKKVLTKTLVVFGVFVGILLLAQLFFGVFG